MHRLLTHAPAIEKPSKADIAEKLAQIKSRILETPEINENTSTLIDLAEQLSEFELGRFLIKNNGALSGHWTHYIILGHDLNTVHHPLEKFILTKSPVTLATRERFFIFQTLLKKYIKSKNKVCSIPCGIMPDLLLLDLDGLHGVELTGIDLDSSVLSMAKIFAEKNKKSDICNFVSKDAWALNLENEFNVLTSNGLNIYEKNDDRVISLYQNFFSSLKTGGTLIGSILTPPPGQHKPSEWRMDKINPLDLQKQISLFAHILQATWANFRTTEETTFQLQQAGFENIKFFFDSQGIFPTFSAQKPQKQSYIF